MTLRKPGVRDLPLPSTRVSTQPGQLPLSGEGGPAPPQRGYSGPDVPRTPGLGGRGDSQGKGHTGPRKLPPGLCAAGTWPPPPQTTARAGTKSVLTPLTHVCLEPFFFPQTEKGSKPESAHSSLCLSVLPPCRPEDSHRHRAGPQGGRPCPVTQGTRQTTDSHQSHAAGPEGWAQAGRHPSDGAGVPRCGL